MNIMPLLEQAGAHTPETRRIVEIALRWAAAQVFPATSFPTRETDLLFVAATRLRHAADKVQREVR